MTNKITEIHRNKLKNEIIVTYTSSTIGCYGNDNYGFLTKYIIIIDEKEMREMPVNEYAERIPLFKREWSNYNPKKNIEILKKVSGMIQQLMNI